jgi:hypothetical protein
LLSQKGFSPLQAIPFCGIEHRGTNISHAQASEMLLILERDLIKFPGKNIHHTDHLRRSQFEIPSQMETGIFVSINQCLCLIPSTF